MHSIDEQPARERTALSRHASGTPAVFMRGGTSKGVFLRERDLPPAGAERDDLLLRIMGTPDRLQIDGVGGTTSSTSKVMVVGEPRDGVVPYAFAQIGVDLPVVDWRGNCGNLTFAVARFVYESGLSDRTMRLHNTNTGVEIEALITENVEIEVAGVPGSAPPITTTYLNPAGAALGSLLPLGAARSRLDVPGIGQIDASLVDATNPYLFVRRDAVPGADRPVEALRVDVEWLDAVERVRAAAAVAVGAATSLDSARTDAAVTPRIVLVSSPGESDGAIDMHALTVSMQQVHRGIPMTGAMCLAAARTLPGTVVAEVAGLLKDGATVIRQPLGLTRATATSRDGSLVGVGITGTARTLMRGEVIPRPLPR